MYELLQIKEKIISDKEYRTWMQKISNVEKEFAISSELEILNNIFEIYYNVHGRKKVNENCEIIK